MGLGVFSRPMITKEIGTGTQEDTEERYR